MSWWGVALASEWLGGAGRRACLVLRRRMAHVADAEHELRGAATAISLAASGSRSPRAAHHAAALRAQLDRMVAALADLAEARDGRRESAPER